MSKKGKRSGRARKILRSTYSGQVLFTGLWGPQILRERCWLCGLFVPSILQAAHLDLDRTNDDPANLACLCLTCHKLQETGFVPNDIILKRRDRIEKGRYPKVEPVWRWFALKTDRGELPDLTRTDKRTPEEKSAAAKQAQETRQLPKRK